MITRLHMTNFKNFQDAELKLGPLTVLVGTNASGKSNLRDAFRFLHGIGRGYNLADIIGGKFGEGGERLWSGIRGGTREIAFFSEKTFTLEVNFTENGNSSGEIMRYQIRVHPISRSNYPELLYELLHFDNSVIFQPSAPPRFGNIVVDYAYGAGGARASFNNSQPILSQIWQRTGDAAHKSVSTALEAFNFMRFLDLDPQAMRQPSFPGQNVLGDRGENLSSVLLAICQEKGKKEMLLSWLQALTPMDAVDMDFPEDQIGRVLVRLVEKNGQRTTAYSASDGTLRFLAIIAALLGPETAKLYFIEELDNGLHPTRLHLLIQLIEQQVAKGTTQIVATTHSPQLLRLLSPESLEYASVLYRAPENPATRIVPILSLPNARQLVQEQDVAQLFESGWLEDALAFQEPAEAAA